MLSYKKLKKLFKHISHLRYIQRIMMWDESVMMPEGSGSYRAESIGTLNQVISKMLTQRNIKNLIDTAKNDPDLSSWDKANVKWMERLYFNATCVPSKLVVNLTETTLAAHQAWRLLRPQNNWKEFSPYLQRSFKVIREIAERKSQFLFLSPYDCLIDEYSPGFMQKDIDIIFENLKSVIPTLRDKILTKQQKEKVIIPMGPFSIEKQKKLGHLLMQILQFDYNHGRLDVSHHPFCDGIPIDIRITTRYNEDDLLESLMGIIHETGHALFEQGMPKKWVFQPVGQIQSKAMHESQALLFENFFCRSQSFLNYFSTKIQDEFENHEALSPGNLYDYVTKIKNTLIRVDADEITYPMHVILRYEIEKDLLNDVITINDLPERWNELMIQYLDISTKGNDQDGVMQDIHWPAGMFGYFPSYTLGQLIAAQIFSAFTKVNSSSDERISAGDFSLIKSWLNENIYKYGSSLNTNDLLIKVTGAALNSEYFIQYIQNKYLD